MLHVVLNAPEIATNTGNIIRLCANVGATLHLVEPLGFSLEHRGLKRAGLDYHELAPVHVHTRLMDALPPPGALGTARCFALSARGQRRYDEVRFALGDVVVFGAERSGLAPEVLAQFAPEARLRLPMRPGNRSLNLANAVAVVVYEAWRQLNFAGGEPEQTDTRTGTDIGPSLAESPGSAPFDTPSPANVEPA
ncbi:MAG: tRNA (cytidine(34)-2'-O)-methyltransferase [Acidimicrobiales bacterium]